MRESIENETRNPYKRFLDRVRFINHSQNYFYEPMTLKELDKIDPHVACQYFNDCFRNPAEFVMCLTGSLEVCLLSCHLSLPVKHSIVNLQFIL